MICKVNPHNFLTTEFKFLTPANEVAGRLCFYTCPSVILFMGRGTSQHAMGQGVSDFGCWVSASGSGGVHP